MDKSSADALLRPGRVDKKLHFALPDRHQCREYFLTLFTLAKEVALNSAEVDEPMELGSAADKWLDSFPCDRYAFAEIKGYLISCLYDKPEASADPQRIKAWQRQILKTRVAQSKEKVREMTN
jgi:hypothetical protein